VDRTLGVMFGVARAIILLAFIYIPLNVLMPKDVKEDVFKDSITYPLIEETSSIIASYLPEGESVKEDVEDQFKQKLKDSDLLATPNQKDQADQPQGTEPAAPAGASADQNQATPPAAGETGYQEDQRQKMQQLFQDPVTNE
jgi:membrane protein required for colicin V production